MDLSGVPRSTTCNCYNTTRRSGAFSASRASAYRYYVFVGIVISIHRAISLCRDRGRNRCSKADRKATPRERWCGGGRVIRNAATRCVLVARGVGPCTVSTYRRLHHDDDDFFWCLERIPPRVLRLPRISRTVMPRLPALFVVDIPFSGEEVVVNCTESTLLRFRRVRIVRMQFRCRGVSCL